MVKGLFNSKGTVTYIKVSGGGTPDSAGVGSIWPAWYNMINMASLDNMANMASLNNMANMASLDNMTNMAAWTIWLA